MAERFIDIEKVEGSIPSGRTTTPIHLGMGFAVDLKIIPSRTRLKFFNHVRGKRSDEDDSNGY